MSEQRPGGAGAPAQDHPATWPADDPPGLPGAVAARSRTGDIAT